MSVSRHALSVVALFVGSALVAPLVSPADAGSIVIGTKVKEKADGKYYRVAYVAEGNAAAQVGEVAVELRSDAGDEDLVLVESDAWLHGSAALAALPAKDAAVALTLYDTGSAALVVFAGTLGADGSVAFGAGEAAGTCDASSRVACSESPAPDVELVAAAVDELGAGRLGLSLDLAGADTYAVAYATLEVAGAGRVEVDWDAVGAVWEGESALAHTGEIDARVQARERGGGTVENVHATLGEPWSDGGEGVNTLSVAEGTSVALTAHFGSDRFAGGHVRTPRMTLVSEGWSATSYPTHAQLELAGGDTVSVPATSYQRRQPITGGSVVFKGSSKALLDPGSTVSITSGSLTFKPRPAADLGAPLCGAGTCVALVPSGEGYELAVTTYGADPARLPDKQAFALVVYDKGGKKVAAETVSVGFDTAVTAVFASELAIDGDPMGVDVSGDVRLLGAASARSGKQDTLARGSFTAAVARDLDGELGLGAYGADESATSDSASSVLVGDPVACDAAGCDDPAGPPVLVFAVGGRVTKIVVSSGGLEYNAF